MRQHLIIAFVASSVVSLAFAGGPAPRRIAVEGDPLANVGTLEHPSFVMKGGAVVKRATP